MEEKTKTPQKQKLALLWRFLKGSKRFFVASILCAGITALADVIQPQIIRAAVDCAIGGKEADFPGFVMDAVARIGGEYRASIGARPARAILIRGEQAEGFPSFVAENAPTEGNIRGSAAYRTHLIRVLVERSMNELGGM